MGVSPYTTPHQLWLLKTGRDEPHDGNWATRRGSAMEPMARAYYELMNDTDMPPALLEHYEFPWLRASMDGWNRKQKIGLEIKCPGAKNHALAMDGKIPDEYFPQLQHQLFVSGAEYIDYFSFDGKRGAVVKVYPDLEYIVGYVSRARSFWELVLTDTAPALLDRDWKVLRAKEFRSLLLDWEQSRSAELEKLILEREDVSGKRVRNTKFKIDGIKREIYIDEQAN